jgi:2,4-dienoyl-CoA reductase (NADPH2)
VLQIGASASSGSDRGVFVEDGSGFWWNYGVTEALVQADRQVTIATPSVSFTLMILV